jgi:hypothetical protein
VVASVPRDPTDQSLSVIATGNRIADKLPVKAIRITAAVVFAYSSWPGGVCE